jgi:hypothetical protein
VAWSLLSRIATRKWALRDGLTKPLLGQIDAMQGRPSAAKAACLAGSNGVAEAMPLQNYPELT